MPSTAHAASTLPAVSPEAAGQTLANHPVFGPLYDKVLRHERITRDEAIAVYEHPDLLALGMLADTARRHRTPVDLQDYVYWVRNYYINPTNICEDHCKFCAFKKGPRSPMAYVLSVEQVVERVHNYPDRDLLREFHIVGGHWRECSLEYFANLFKALRKEFPHVAVKALTAAEIDYIAKIEGITWEQTLDILKEAGLQAMPGGGAEVFSQRVRALVCPDKISGETWCHIHGLAHQRGIRSNCTMLAGLGETAEERIDHIIALRDQQDKTGGFFSFIPLNCYYENTPLDPNMALTGVENLKNFAIARLLLDNFDHVKSFWVHMGEKISQVGLYFGVDDVDGTVVQEKIAHSAGAGTSQALTDRELTHLIRSAGRVPAERDAFYNLVAPNV